MQTGMGLGSHINNPYNVVNHQTEHTGDVIHAKNEDLGGGEMGSAPDSTWEGHNTGLLMAGGTGSINFFDDPNTITRLSSIGLFGINGSLGGSISSYLQRGFSNIFDQTYDPSAPSSSSSLASDQVPPHPSSSFPQQNTFNDPDPSTVSSSLSSASTFGANNGMNDDRSQDDYNHRERRKQQQQAAHPAHSAAHDALMGTMAQLSGTPTPTPGLL